MTDKPQAVLNAAARIVSCTRQHDRGLTQLLYVDLHWLDVADLIRYKLDATVHRCLYYKVPQYLADCRVALSDIAGRQHTITNQLDVPRYQRGTLGHRTFPVAGPTVWNSLPDELRDPSSTDANCLYSR